MEECAKSSCAPIARRTYDGSRDADVQADPTSTVAWSLKKDVRLDMTGLLPSLMFQYRAPVDTNVGWVVKKICVVRLTGREGHVLEGHEQALTLDVGERQVDTPGVSVRCVAVANDQRQLSRVKEKDSFICS
jgi:hypothetical protein